MFCNQELGVQFVHEAPFFIYPAVLIGQGSVFETDGRRFESYPLDHVFLSFIYLICMKCYHGSRSYFKQFNIKGDGKHGEGFYFTKDKNEAHIFAKTLYGNGEDKNPTVYTVTLKVSNLFDTMNAEHCQLVMESIGQKFKAHKNVGGAKEHYYFLCRQLKAWGINDPNEAILKAGFDGIYYAFCEHIIVFDKDHIEIVEIEAIDL